MATRSVKVTTYKVNITKGYAPHGKWVTFTDKEQADRYFNRCTEGSARLVTVHPNTTR